MNVVIVESCHSTWIWIFEPRQLRFCRMSQ
jgi:hypothetical protein